MWTQLCGEHCALGLKRGKAEEPSESPGTALAVEEITPRLLTQSQMVNMSWSES